ncbi:MAG TPA: type I glyceraldehyde-3-phosphate dehydrogenase [Candidatus Saccharimonadales bacterium]|nr:type I glyceraldehyde-3-phosphate dehydrogenase [Candidatus Saccharimonadales bacterium]
MKTKIAINGFGRIGRNAFKIAHDRSDLEIVAVNDLTDTKTLAHLLKHDSNYGAYDAEVGYDDQNLIVNGQKIRVLAEKDPAALPWKDLGVEVVIESTGFFVDPEKAKAHIAAGAKKVVLSAPAKGEGATTIVLGVNEDKLKLAGEVISNASCTTNCITPVMAVLEQHFGIDKAMMTTVHSYTASQKLQDAPAKDLREARNAAENIVPTTTGASIAAAKAMPALEGVFGGLSVRVPTPVVSLSDFVVVTKKEVTVDEVNEVFKKAAADPFYQGILDVTEEELVSSDFIGNSHSAIVDLKLTHVVGGNLLKVVAWYDNEWGYSNRLVEVTADVGKLLQGGDSGGAPVPAAVAAPADAQPQPGVAPVDPETPTPAAEPMLEAPAEAKEELLPAPQQSMQPQAEQPFQPTPASDFAAPAPTPAASVQESPTPAAANQAPAQPLTNPNGSIDGFRQF